MMTNFYVFNKFNNFFKIKIKKHFFEFYFTENDYFATH